MSQGTGCPTEAESSPDSKEWEPLIRAQHTSGRKPTFILSKKMALDLETIRAICNRVCGSLGLELVDVEFKGGAGKQGRILRIVIDKVPTREVAGANASASKGSAADNI